MEEITYTVGSDNVYADLGYECPDEMRAKAELVFRLAHIIAERGLTQVQAAEILGLPQPKVSALLRGHFSGFSLERIIRLLIALDTDVAIVVTPTEQGRAHLSVVAR